MRPSAGLGRLFLSCAIASMAVQQPALAQGAGVNNSSLRRTALLSVMAERTRRGGGDLPFSLCSVLDAIGMIEPTLGDAPAFRTSIVGDTAMVRCDVLRTRPAGDPWRPHVDVVGVAVARREVGAPIVSVTVRAWSADSMFAVEVYEFAATAEPLWTAQRVVEHCCQSLDRPEPSPATPLIILNGEPQLPGATIQSALLRVRGQLVDSIKVLPATDSTLAKYQRWGSNHGAVIIGTHPASRRP